MCVCVCVHMRAQVCVCQGESSGLEKSLYKISALTQPLLNASDPVLPSFTLSVENHAFQHAVSQQDEASLYQEPWVLLQCIFVS